MVDKKWLAYPKMAKQLKQTQTFLLNQIQVRPYSIQANLKALLENGGKMLRPAYFYLFSEFGQQSPERLLKGAAAMEVLHLATLIHDDVIDQSPLRRDTETINLNKGNKNAIYAGDYLFTLYFSLLNQAALNRQQIDYNAKIMRQILIGELDQLYFNHCRQITTKDYLRVIGGKTAALFELSCYFGAQMAQADPQIAKRAKKIGRYTGMAFQILDDILDYDTDNQQLSKPSLEDIQNGTYSLPLILALQQEPKRLAPLLETEIITAQHAQEIADIVIASGGVKQAQKIAQTYTQKALLEVELLPDCHAKKQLEKITRELVNRSF